MRKLAFRLDETQVFTIDLKRKAISESGNSRLACTRRKFAFLVGSGTLQKQSPKIKETLQKWAFRFDETQIRENGAKKGKLKKRRKWAFRVGETALCCFCCCPCQLGVVTKVVIWRRRDARFCKIEQKCKSAKPGVQKRKLSFGVGETLKNDFCCCCCGCVRIWPGVVSRRRNANLWKSEKMKKWKFASRAGETTTFEQHRSASHAPAQAKRKFLMKMSVSRRRDATVVF